MKWHFHIVSTGCLSGLLVVAVIVTDSFCFSFVLKVTLSCERRLEMVLEEDAAVLCSDWRVGGLSYGVGVGRSKV